MSAPNLFAPALSVDPTGGGLASYGIAGTVAAIFLAGIVWIGRTYINELKQQRDTERARADRLEAELRQLSAVTEDRIEAIQQSSTAALDRGYAALVAAFTAARDRRHDRP